MKRVLIGFEQPKLVKELGRRFQKMGIEEVSFESVNRKASVLEEIENGTYDAVLLMEECGNELWSMDEFCQLKETYNVHLIPIISERYKTEKYMVPFCNSGITSAVFINEKKHTYRMDDVVNVLLAPRSLKEARAYYGVASIADIQSGNVFDEIMYDDIRSRLLDESTGVPLGERYLYAIQPLTRMQVCQLLSQLDKELLLKLRKTVEYWDVYEALKGVIKSPEKTPRDIKILRKEREKQSRYIENTSYTEEKNGEQDGFSDSKEEKIIDGEYRQLVEEAVEEDMEEDMEEDGDEQEEPSLAPIIAEPEEDADEDEFSFSPVMKVAKQRPNKENRTTEQEIRFKQSTDEKYKKLPPAQMPFDDEISEIKPKKEIKNLGLIIGAVSLLVVVFLLILVFLFVKISVERKQQAVGTITSGYDQRYPANEVNQFDLTDTGGLVMVDESGAEMGNVSSSQIELPEENMNFTIETTSSEIFGEGEQQSFNDIGAFEPGHSYKGLELIHMLNGSQGCDCELKMKNGAVISVLRGNASIEDFKPSAQYECSVEDNTLYFTEK